MLALVFLTMTLLSLLAAPPAQAHAVALAWDYPADSGAATGFLIERCRGNGCTAYATLMSVPLPRSPLAYTDRSIQSGKKYRWRVRAVAPDGWSDPSAPFELSVPRKGRKAGVVQKRY